MIGFQPQIAEIIVTETISSRPQRVLELAVALARTVVVQLGVFAEKAHLGRAVVLHLHLHAQFQLWPRVDDLLLHVDVLLLAPIAVANRTLARARRRARPLEG